MFYLIQKNGIYSVLYIRNTEYHILEMRLRYVGYTLHGQFGRKDYAETWKEYYNKGGYRKLGAINI